MERSEMLVEISAIQECAKNLALAKQRSYLGSALPVSVVIVARAATINVTQGSNLIGNAAPQSCS